MIPPPPDPETAEREPRWRRRPTERRREILEAAVQVFGDQGFDQCTLVDVARRAGVSAGTIVHYFRTKADLFEAVLSDRLYQGFAEEEAVLATHRGSYRELVAILLRRLWNRLQRPGTADLIMVGLAHTQTFPETGRMMFRELKERWRRLFSAVIDAGIKSGEFRPVNPDLVSRILAGSLVGMIAGHARMACFDPSAPSADDLLATYLELVDHALIA